MKKIAILSVPILAAASAWAGLNPHAQQINQQQQQQMERSIPKPVVRTATLMPAENLTFKEVMKGVSKADLWGGPKTLHAAITKFAAGAKFGLHTHTSTVAMVVISGTIIHCDEAGAETKLGPGSYISIPGGVKHTTACAAGSDCVFYEEVGGEFDVKMDEAPKAP